VTTTEKKRLRVGVLFGGRSGEHEVSLASAASVIRGLDLEKYEAVPIGISKDGRWLVGTGAQKMLPEVLKTGQRVVLPADPNAATLVPLDENRAGAMRVDVIFPVLHGTFGEDGTVQGLLALAGGTLVFVALVAVLGFFLYAIRPVIQAWMLETTPKNMGGSSIGILFGAQALGAAIGPLLAGMVADRYGIGTVFYFLAATIVLANLFVVFTPKSAALAATTPAS